MAKLPTRYTDYDFIIGIDPGTHTGYAVANPRTKSFVTVESLAVHDLLVRLHVFKEDGKKVLVRCENPTTWVPFKTSNRHEHTSRLQGAGSVKRDFKIVRDACAAWGIEFEPVGLHSAMKKMGAEKFRDMSGWQQRTNEHSRDAACLLLGVIK